MIGYNPLTKDRSKPRKTFEFRIDFYEEDFSPEGLAKVHAIMAHGLRLAPGVRIIWPRPMLIAEPCEPVDFTDWDLDV